MNKYEKFVETSDSKPMDVQFYLDGMNEEHGEISGVIKRMRRGDYNKLDLKYGLTVSGYLTKFGLKETLDLFDKCMEDLVKEIGDHHWYQTRFNQTLGLSWNDIESLNVKKLKKRIKQNRIIGKGSYREEWYG